MSRTDDPRAGSAHLVGVAGTGMRGLATLLLQNGWRVSGTDACPLPDDDPLLEDGLIWVEPDAVCWDGEEVCVRSAAIPDRDPRIVAARAAGVEPCLYADMLGRLTETRPMLAVCGTHGKTTTTAWIAWALRASGIECGWLVGGHSPQLGDSAAWGDPSAPLIVESCEFNRSFHKLRPRWAALLNVDHDHVDTYPSLASFEAAFEQFLRSVPSDGAVFAGPQAPRWSARFPSLPWHELPTLPQSVPVGLPGDYNRQNAALVAGVLRYFGVGESAIGDRLTGFEGTSRRFETLGALQGASVVSDYAHHPEAVSAVVATAREQTPNGKVWVVFQPHQASRFCRFLDRFAASLADADGVILLPVYRARDPEELLADIEDLASSLAADLPVAVCDADGARQMVLAWAGPGDTVLCLGAGDIDRMVRSWLTPTLCHG